jgi:hypothetical protein
MLDKFTKQCIVKGELALAYPVSEDGEAQAMALLHEIFQFARDCGVKEVLAIRLRLFYQEEMEGLARAHGEEAWQPGVVRHTCEGTCGATQEAVQQVKALLERALPGRKVEVLNLAELANAHGAPPPGETQSDEEVLEVLKAEMQRLAQSGRKFEA